MDLLLKMTRRIAGDGFRAKVYRRTSSDETVDSKVKVED